MQECKVIDKVNLVEPCFIYCKTTVVAFYVSIYYISVPQRAKSHYSKSNAIQNHTHPAVYSEP